MKRRRFTNNAKALEPLSFEALEDGMSLSFDYSKNGTVYYKIDDGEWMDMQSAVYTEVVNKGSIIYVQGRIGSFAQFTIDGKCKVSGCCSSILYGLNSSQYSVLKDNCFYGLFYMCSSLIEVDDILPATTLAYGCYEQMFAGCINLIKVPELPATTLADNCYREMFYGCTSLVNAPALPATTLAVSCYYEMFYGCTSLVNAPALPATTLAGNCYYEMFYGCTSLVNAPALPATTLAGNCYREMFYDCTKLNYIKMLAVEPISTYLHFYKWVKGVSSTGTFVKNPDMNSLSTGESGIPSGWTVQNATS